MSEEGAGGAPPAGGLAAGGEQERRGEGEERRDEGGPERKFHDRAEETWRDPLPAAAEEQRDRSQMEAEHGEEDKPVRRIRPAIGAAEALQRVEHDEGRRPHRETRDHPEQPRGSLFLHGLPSASGASAGSASTTRRITIPLTAV